MATTTRQALSVVSDKKLNIISNSTPKKRTLHVSSSLNSKRISLKDAPTDFDTIMNNHLKRKSDQLDHIDSLDVSPNLKRARILRMKLQLAYYKVKTNQIETKTHNLKYFDKNIFSNNVSLEKPVLNNNYPLSAPPTTLAFSNIPYTAKYNASVTSPSRFAISQPSLKRLDRNTPTPPLARFSTANAAKSNSLLAREITRSQSTNYPNETTIDCEATILQNDSMSTPLVRRHSVDIVDSNTHDPDTTILQSSILVSTPIRKRAKKSGIDKGSNKQVSFTRDDTIECENVELDNNLNINNDNKKIISNDKPSKKCIAEEEEEEEEDSTRLFSSPTRERLLCTPSSTAAAKCLLQLAHR